MLIVHDEWRKNTDRRIDVQRGLLLGQVKVLLDDTCCEWLTSL